METGRYEPCRYCGRNTQGYINSAWPLSGFVCYECKQTKYKDDIVKLYSDKDKTTKS